MALTFSCCPSVTSRNYVSGTIKTRGSVTRGQNVGWIVSANVEVGKNGERESGKECEGPGAKVIQKGERVIKGWVDHSSKTGGVLEWSDGRHFTRTGVCEGNGHGDKENTDSILISREHGEEERKEEEKKGRKEKKKMTSLEGAMVSSRKRAKLW